MGDPIRDLLATKRFLLADGAMGTNLFAVGLQSGDSPEMWNLDHPDRIAGVHEGFVNAGSDIILTNTFGGTRQRLKLHGADDRVAELNLAAARIARGVADSFERTVLVAGSMGPTGELMQPMGPLTIDEAADAFAEQATALAEGGVDLLWVETMSSLEEAGAALRGAATTGLPTICTMTFDTARHTMMGVAPAEFSRFCRSFDPRPAAWGANCGVGAPELLETVLGISSTTGPDDLLVAKGNCGIPSYVDGRLVYSGTPAVMAMYARLAIDAGARIVGGCCGTSYEHLRAMAASLRDYTPGARPVDTELEAIFGSLWPRGGEDGVEEDAEAAAAAIERRQRRRRRA